MKYLSFRAAPRGVRYARLFVFALSAWLAPLQAQEVVGPAGPLRFGALYAGSAMGEPNATVFRFVERAEFGGGWPLVANNAYIGCARALPRVTVMVVADGVASGMNSESKAWLKDNKAELEIDGRKVLVNAGSQGESWLDEDPEFPGTHKSIGVLVDSAKRLGCLAKVMPKM